jgi:hypothetical protein
MRVHLEVALTAALVLGATQAQLLWQKTLLGVLFLGWVIFVMVRAFREAEADHQERRQELELRCMNGEQFRRRLLVDFSFAFGHILPRMGEIDIPQGWRPRVYEFFKELKKSNPEAVVADIQIQDGLVVELKSPLGMDSRAEIALADKLTTLKIDTSILCRECGYECIPGEPLCCDCGRDEDDDFRDELVEFLEEHMESCETVVTKPYTVTITLHKEIPDDDVDRLEL